LICSRRSLDKTNEMYQLLISHVSGNTRISLEHTPQKSWIQTYWDMAAVYPYNSSPLPNGATSITWLHPEIILSVAQYLYLQTIYTFFQWQLQQKPHTIHVSWVLILQDLHSSYLITSMSLKYSCITTTIIIVIVLLITIAILLLKEDLILKISLRSWD
jgi:hypothetical protein